MRRFFINFRNSAKDRASQISRRAYSHYLSIKPIVVRIKGKLRYGKSQKGTSIPR